MYYLFNRAGALPALFLLLRVPFYIAARRQAAHYDLIKNMKATGKKCYEKTHPVN